MSKLKILFTHREMDVAVHYLATSLSRREEWEVYITRPGQRSVVEYCEGITYLEIPEFSSKLSWRSIWALRAYCRSYDFDLIYSAGSTGLSNAILASWGCRAINVGYRGTGARIRRLDPTYYLGILPPRLRHVVCETDHIAKYLRQFLPQSCLSVACKPFDIAWCREAGLHPIEIIPPTSGYLRLIFVGNTLGRPYKGLRTLLNALAILQDPRISLVMVGNYDDEDKTFADSLPIAEYIHFVGQQPEGMRYIAGADCYVLSSSRDASPRVIREAMALGLPTIVSDIPGSRDLIIPEQTGLLFPSGDSSALAKCIRWMLEHPNQRQQMGPKVGNVSSKISPLSPMPSISRTSSLVCVATVNRLRNIQPHTLSPPIINLPPLCVHSRSIYLAS